MPKSSPLLVFAYVKGINSYLSKDMSIDVFNEEPNKFKPWMNKSKPWFINVCKRLHLLIENGHFTYKDIIVHLISQRLFDKKDASFAMNEASIKNTKELLTKDTAIKDRRIAEYLFNSSERVKTIKDIIEIKKTGSCILHQLVLERKLSPMFPMYLLTKNQFDYDTTNNECSMEFHRFMYVLKKLTDVYINYKESVSYEHRFRV